MVKRACPIHSLGTFGKDSRLRAVLAAARFCDTLAEEGLEGQSGVATGTVWCGPGLRHLRPVRPQG
jgi:hypothetical protein